MTGMPLAAALLAVAPKPAPEPAFSYGWAAVELGVAMGAGVAWYEAKIEANKLDFDFPRTWSGQWERLTGRGYRFDDNNTTLNVGHAFMGLYYHQLARVNHGTTLQAFLFDLTTSSVWELAVEHREVFSLNDTVVTAVGGLAIGEPLYQVGELFGRSAPTLRNRALMALFSPARAVASLTERGRLPRAAALDDHGLAGDAYHRFTLSAGAAGATSLPETPGVGAGAGGALFAARLDLDLVNLPAYGRAGRLARRVRGGEVTGITVDYAGARGDLRALTIATRTSLFGRYAQDVAGEGAERRGHGVLVAAGSAFDLSVWDRGAFTDFITAVHAIGPTADASFYRGRFALRLGTDAYGDFAMVRPFALPAAPPPELLAGTKSILANEHYYYAWGVTAAARAVASYRRVGAGASVEWSGFDSIEGLDRRQDGFTSPTGMYHAGVSDDFDVTDQRLKLRVHGEVPAPLPDLSFGLSWDLQRRSGQMKGLARADVEQRAAVVLSYVM